MLVLSVSLDEEIAKWKQLVDDSNDLLLWINIIVHALLCIIYSTALLLVIFYYKRRETFLLAIPTLFLAEVFFGGIYWALVLKEVDPCDKTGQCEPIPRVVYTLTVFTSFYPHLLFASQYLKTSMTLPKLLTQAQVEVKQ